MKTIIFVESNPELSAIIASFYDPLEVSYDSASDAEYALDLIRDIQPDLVISNTELTDKDGFDLLNSIQQDENVKHIPVILYSLAPSKAEREKAKEVGAKDYWGMPDDRDIALSGVRTLLGLKLKDVKPASLAIRLSWRENAFAIKLNKIISEHIADVELNLDTLAQKMQVSSSTLQKNLKKYQGKSVSQYVREFRLQCSKEQIDKGGLTLTEIASRFGFRNLSYFSRSYKDFFGHSPSANS